MTTPLYQLVEDVVLEHLENRIKATGLRFYAWEENRQIETPAIIVKATTGAENPPQSPIYDVEVTVTLRATISDEFTRDTFGAIYQTIRENFNDSKCLKADLTKGRLSVFGASFDDEDEGNIEGQTIERTHTAVILASYISKLSEPLPSPPVDPDPDPDPVPPNPDPPAGLWVAPAGLPENDGTYDSPWDFISALDGSQTIPEGSTINFKPGYYEQKWGTTGYDSRYYVALVGTAAEPIILKPEEINGVKQHVRIDGRFDAYAGTQHVHIYDIDFHQTTDIPIAEPTAPGSYVPGLDQWGSKA